MDERDIEKTAFSVPNGHFEFLRLPMGLRNAPSSFQRLMYAVFAGLVGFKCLVYLDDIIVYSGNNEDEHIERLTEVFERMRKFNLKFKPNKCQFLKPEVKYLGHIISAAGVAADKEKTRIIDNYPQPRTRKQVRAFLGLAGFYRRFVPKFSQIAQPLNNLLKQDTSFVWDTEAETAFNKLKKALTTPPILRFPDFHREFILVCDASTTGISAILSQKFPGKGEHAVSYASRTLNKAERNYSTIERELLAIIWGISHYRCYLLGTHFKIITDHKPIKYIMSVKNPSSRLAKWTLKLMEYSFDIEYRKGTLNSNADALTRLSENFNFSDNVNIISNSDELEHDYIPIIWDFESIKREQQLDKTIQNLKHMPGFYQAHNGLIYKQRQENERQDQLLVPVKMQPEILSLHHATPVACHPGVHKTIQNIKMQFYWKNLTADVKKFVSSCHSCNIHKTYSHPPAALLISDIPNEVFGKVSIDIVGPLNITKNGNRYILTCIDYLTRYAEAIPLPNIQASTIARAFVEKVVLRHGTPQILLSDNGSQFISNIFREICNILDIKKLCTTVYRPQANSVLERVHRSIKQMISHFVTETDPSWDLYLPFILSAYNNSIHSSTNETPFYLMYGRDFRQAFYSNISPHLVSYDLSDNYASELRFRLSKVHKEVIQRLHEVAIKQAERFNKKSKTRTFQEGELVYMKKEPKAHSNLATSFQPKWTGPFRIIKILSPVNYTVRNLETGKETKIHVNRLKPYHSEKQDTLSKQPFDLLGENKHKFDPTLQLYYPFQPTTPPAENLHELEDPPDNESDGSEDSDIIPQNFFNENNDDSDYENNQNANPPEPDVQLDRDHPYQTRQKGPVPNYDWVLRRAI